jgi:hypothetical protein
MISTARELARERLVRSRCVGVDIIGGARRDPNSGVWLWPARRPELDDEQTGFSRQLLPTRAAVSPHLFDRSFALLRHQRRRVSKCLF